MSRFDDLRRLMGAAGRDRRGAHADTHGLVRVVLVTGVSLVLVGALRRLADLQIDVLVWAVVLSVTLARTASGAPPAERVDRFVVLPLIAVLAVSAQALGRRYPGVADLVFIVIVSLAIWVRRFGPRATRAGTLAMLPMLATIVIPLPRLAHSEPPALWAAVVALIVCAVLALTQALLDRLVPADRRITAPVGESATPDIRRKSPLPSTRMAVQMAFALTAAALIGPRLFPAHHSWVLLTAFLVCSGARGRGDVLHKGLLRTGGAMLGAMLATLIGWLVAAHESLAVVMMLLSLALGVWLRSVSYAWWAAAVTAAVSLFNVYFGSAEPGFLLERLAGIVIGAAIGTAASWWIMPIRSVDVARRRFAEVLATFSEFLRWQQIDDPGRRHLLARLSDGVAQLDQVAGAFAAHRRWHRVVRLGRLGPRGDGRPVSHLSDAFDAMRACLTPAGHLVDLASATVALEQDARLRRLTRGLQANVGAVRRAIGNKPGAPYVGLSADSFEGVDAPGIAGVASVTAAAAALLEIDRRMAILIEVFQYAVM